MKNKRYIALFLMMVVVGVVNSQGGGPPGPGGGVPPPPGLPIDGGLLFLLISGILYGVNKKIKS